MTVEAHQNIANMFLMFSLIYLIIKNEDGMPIFAAIWSHVSLNFLWDIVFWELRLENLFCPFLSQAEFLFLKTT